MDSPSAPPVPDPFKTAAAQGAENASAARLNTSLNRPDQVTPYGSLRWEQSPGTRTFNQERYDAAVRGAQGQAAPGATSNPATDSQIQLLMQGQGKTREEALSMLGLPASYGLAPAASGQMPDRNADEFYDTSPGDRWTSRIELDPRVQQLLDSQLATSQGLNTSVNNSLGQVNEMFTKPPPEANEQVRDEAETALYRRYASRLDPQFQQQEQRMRSELMNRGMVEGSEGWNDQFDVFNRGKTDAYGAAMDSSILGGGAEMQRQLQMEQASRLGVINELGALRTGTQAQMPAFSSGMSGTTVAPAPLGQSVYNSYQGQLGQYNADVGAQNSQMSGLASLGGSAMMAYAAFAL
jgi:hypothetical protein